MDFYQNLDWSVPTWDLFIILFFAIGALLYGMSMGRDRVVVVLVSIYMALAVVGNAPVLQDVNAIQFSFNDNVALRIGAFIVIFMVLFFLVSRSALLHTIGRNSRSGSWWQTIIFSILQVGLFISICMSFLPADVLDNFTDTTQQVFTSYWGKSGWMILPILFMAVAPRGKKVDDE